MKVLLTILISIALQVSHAPVRYVIDGDTFIIKNDTYIRLVGINTPEINHEYPQYSDYYAYQARIYLERLIGNRNVRLEYDKERLDKYGRTLCYVYIDTLFVNAELIRQGYARVMTVPPNTKYKELFIKLEKQARLKNKGLWKRN